MSVADIGIYMSTLVYTKPWHLLTRLLQHLATPIDLQESLLLSINIRHRSISKPMNWKLSLRCNVYFAQKVKNVFRMVLTVFLLLCVFYSAPRLPILVSSSDPIFHLPLTPLHTLTTFSVTKALMLPFWRDFEFRRMPQVQSFLRSSISHFNNVFLNGWQNA
jgi:hypothetical protein